LEVVEAIDGPIQLNECVGNEGACTFDDNCPIKLVWCTAQEELVQRLKSTNFADLITQPV
jgi:DNA-binding IscR family transcriptional regulator